MFNGVLIAALGVSVLEWVAVWRKWTRVRYFTKPGAMLALIAWYTLSGGMQGEGLWFGVGFVFSLAGDIFLLLSHGWFIFGLLSFLVAHLLYIVGFNQTLPSADPGILAAAVAVVGVGYFVFRGILAALRAGSETPPAARLEAGSKTAPLKGKMRLMAPVIVYALVISVMLFSAMICYFRPGWSQSAALLAVIGAGLFFLSDSVLANQKFVRPVRGGDVIVMVTYLLGQYGIAAAALLAFGG